MKIVTPYSLLLGLVMTGPGLYQAFADSSVDVVPALLHFIVASLVAGLGLAVLTTLVSAYSQGHGRRTPLASSTGAAEPGDRTLAVTPETATNDNLVTS